jgi:hypothetical protein
LFPRSFLDLAGEDNGQQANIIASRAVGDVTASLLDALQPG